MIDSICEAKLLRFGYKASAEQFRPNELLKFACLAEEVGFDSIFADDPFHRSDYTEGHIPYSFAWFGALGARTSKVLFGTSVLTPTFQYDPSIVAQAAATMAKMFDDRFVLGVGTGESVNHASALEVGWPSFDERKSRLRESIELIRLLWSEEHVSFRGKYYRVENTTISDRPELDIPIYMAACDPTTAMMAGELADGLICTSGKNEEFYTELLLPNFKEGVSQSGRRTDSVDKIIDIKVSFDTDLETVRNSTRHRPDVALSPEERSSAKNSLETERQKNTLTPEELASPWIVSPDPKEHAEKIMKFIELGFFHLVFHYPGSDQENFLRLYADQVLPRLRAKYGGFEVTKATRLKELENENGKLRKLLAEQMVDNLTLKEMLGKKSDAWFEK